MPIDSKWWLNSGDQTTAPFKNNTVGGITATSLREFAQDVADNGVPAQWFQIESGAVTEGTYTGWATNDTAIDVWFEEDGTETVSRSASWTQSLNADPTHRALTMQYSGGDDCFVHVTISSSSITLSGITDGTTIRPIAWLGSGPDTLTTLISAGSPVTTTTSSTSEVIDLTSSAVLPFFSGVQEYIRIGVRLTPPSGSPVEATSATVDFGTSTGLVVARPAAASV